MIHRTVPYSTALERDIPRRKDKITDPLTEKMCWHCGEFPIMETELKALPWCTRCYAKMFEKMDGTYIQHDSIPALQKLLADQKDGKLKDVPLASVDARTKYIKE